MSADEIPRRIKQDLRIVFPFVEVYLQAIVDGAAAYDGPEAKLAFTKGDRSATLYSVRDDSFGSAKKTRGDAFVGRRIADRYVLFRILGRGGHGEVWQAEDTLDQTFVAIKLLRSGTIDEPARVRREVSALRLLRIPGVVQMLDEGIDDGQPFMVMERISGHPFPGTSKSDWSKIEMVTRALLETLDRVHAVGVVHGDIKPGNVLVDVQGRPTLLDFSLARGPTLARETKVDDYIQGTPDYLAPEQIVGDALTPASDLYSLGVMLYEALSGRLPHETNDFQTLLRLRLTEAPPHLETIAPDVPKVIATTIDALLAREPKDRPQTAGELLERLRDRNAPAPNARGTFYGDRKVVEKLVRAGQEKRALDLVGMRGTGRTRTLQEVAAALEQAGIHVVWAIPGKRAFSSLVNIIPLPEDTSPRNIENVIREVDRALGEKLECGQVLIADDEARLDRQTRAALERARLRGAVIRSFDAEDLNAPTDPNGLVDLPTWTELQLRDLFVPADRIFHLGEDAARELHLRSQGLPLRIFRELGAWERAGLVQKVGTQWLASREALDLLAVGRTLEPMRADAMPPAPSNTARNLPRGAEGRLFHLIAAQTIEPTEIVSETLILVESLVLQGWLGQATALLGDGLRAARRAASPDLDWGETRLLEWLVELAIADGSPRALDSALYELCRATNRGAEIGALEGLVRAALAMRTIAGPRAISLADGIAPFANQNLERRRQHVRVQAARRCSLEDERAVLEDVNQWALDAGEWAQASYSGWLGRLRYREGRFDEAADLQSKAAAGEIWMTERILAMSNAASALVEVFRFDDAVDIADEARHLAAQCRHPYFEARSEWLVRTARYRRGDALGVDGEFVDLVGKTGVLDLEALAALTEAAIAWRAGNMEQTAELARRAEQRWTTLGKTWGALFARTLACVAAGTTEESEPLVEAAKHSPVPGAGIQMLGLLARAHPQRAVEFRAVIKTLRSVIPERHWSFRMDVLSVNEAWQYVTDQHA